VKHLFRRKISLEIGFWLLIVALLPLTLNSAITHINTRQALLREQTAHLKDLLHEKVERIDLYVLERSQSVRLMADTPSVAQALDRCARNFSAHGMEPDKLAALAGQAHPYLTATRDRFGYYDIFLINRNGDIVYTLTKENDLGTNLHHGPYRDSGLDKVFDQAFELLDTEITSFAFYPPSKKPAAFIAAPVFAGKSLLGVVAVQLNEDALFYILADYLGLGESGELVAGRLLPDDRIVAAGPLRHQPDALNQQLVYSGGPVLPLRLAVNGQKGNGLTVDYRGREVLAAWEYVPSMAWGLVAKIDRTEAMAPIHSQDILAGVLLLAALLLVAGGVFLATGRIAKPIAKLTATVQCFASGNFNVRAESREDNEVGTLATHFNDMADTIEKYTFSMQKEVAQRTEDLARAKHSLDRAQEIAHVGSWEWDMVNNHLSWSDEIYRIFGLEPQQFAATYDAFLEAVHPDDRQLVTGAVQEALDKNVPYSVDHRVVRPNGAIRIVHERGEIKRDQAGKPLTMTGAVQDVTALRQARRQLEQYIDIVDENVITSATDREGTITYASDAFCRISGYTREELLGKNHRIVRHPDIPASLYEELWATITAGRIWRGTIKNRAKEGHDYWVEITIAPTRDDQGNITGYTAIHHDITDKKRIEKISVTDELTTLFNRRRFNDLFPQELNRARRDNKTFAFLMVDIDHFKMYNDTYGHQKGDEVLRQVGGEIKKQFKRSGDFAFRLGGEEFGAVLTVQEPGDALAMAERLRQTIEGLNIPHEKNHPGRLVTISCGLMVLPAGKNVDIDTDAIYRMADAALYQAKEAGRNRVKLFTADG